jgi:hypothetical protein
MGFRRRPRFPALSLPLLIAPLVLGGLAALATELKGNIVVYKIKLPGPSAWAAPSQPSRWVVLDVVDGRSVVLRQSTLVVDGFTGFSKWWDHPVTASRACKRDTEGWSDPVGCVTGNGNLIQLPEGASPFTYIFEIKWDEAGQTQTAAVKLQESDKPAQIRSIQ